MVGTLSATVTLVGGNPGVSFGSSGALSANVVPLFTAPAAFTGSGALTATVVPGAQVPVTLTGSGALTVPALSQIYSPPGALTGNGALVCSRFPQFLLVPPPFTSEGTLSATAMQLFASAAGFSGVGVLSASAPEQFPTAAALTGDGALSALAEVLASPQLAGSGALSAATIQQFLVATALTGSGALSATRSVAGGPVFDAMGASGTAQFATTITWTHTCLGNRVFVKVSTNNGTTSSVKYGTSSMTKLAAVGHNNNTANGELSLWTLTSPPTTQQSITATLSISTYATGQSISYSGVSSVGTAATIYGSGNPSQAMTATAGQVLLHGFGATGSGGAFTAPSGGTTRFNGTAYLGSYGSLLIQDATASATFAATIGDNYSGIGIVLS